jgi:MFS family permease
MIVEIGLDRRITSDLGQHRPTVGSNLPSMQVHSILRAGPTATLYWGWLVVAAAFVVAMFGFGLGFYGPGIYLVALKARHGWSTEEISSAITVYYILGAGLLFFVVGPLFDRWGARPVVTIGSIALACGTVSLTRVTQPWQVYTGFGVMSLGWATMSGAAINIIVAPWFERRRGLALNWAMNGGSAGGVVIAPLVVLMISRFGFAVGLEAAAALMLAVLVPVAMLVLRPKRADENDSADSCSEPAEAFASNTISPSEIAPFRLRTALRSRAFITTSIPFALGLTAQVGFLTHQIAFLSPMIGTIAAGWAVSLTTFAAVVGRITAGFVVDRYNQRVLASLNFVMQALGIAILAAASEAPVLYLGCLLVGAGVGNASSLPGLIVQQEFPKQHFARTVSLVVAINQFSFAFGPTLLAQLQHATGSYTAALLVCLAAEIAAAIVVLAPAVARRRAAAVS